MARKREKSEQTLAAIVAAGMDIAVNTGLQNLTLNSIAQKLGISKSGVFVRVGSLESLQILVLDEYERVFALTVFMPTLSEPAGLPRLNAIVHRWVHHGNELTALIATILFESRISRPRAAELPIKHMRIFSAKLID